MSNRRIAGLQSPHSPREVHPRLIAASGGDVDHARRVQAELERKGADVIRLPRPYDREAEAEADARRLELLEGSPRPVVTLAVWAAIGLGAWVAAAAIAFGLYELVGWLT